MPTDRREERAHNSRMVSTSDVLTTARDDEKKFIADGAALAERVTGGRAAGWNAYWCTCDGRRSPTRYASSARPNAIPTAAVKIQPP